VLKVERFYVGRMRSSGTSTRLTPLKLNRSSTRYVEGSVEVCSSTVSEGLLDVLTELHTLDRQVREVDLDALIRSKHWYPRLRSGDAPHSQAQVYTRWRVPCARARAWSVSQ